MNEKKIYPIYFTFGALAIYLLFFILPGVIGIGYSFTDWTSYSKEIHFVGLENFKTIFSGDEKYLFYIKNTIIFTFVTSVAKTVLGLALAVLLTQKLAGRNFHRAVLFLPSVLSMVTVGIVFKAVFEPDTGILNVMLRALGLDFMAMKWLGDPNIAFGSVMAVDVWKGVGYIVTILIAGIQSVDTTYYEAADIDSANGFQKFRYITLPLIMPSLMVSTVLNVVYGLRAFDIIYVLTNGGPGYTTEVMGTAVLKEFSLGKYSTGTAISSIIFVFMALIGFFIIKLMSRNEVDE